MSTTPKAGQYTPILTGILWADFAHRPFRKSVKLVKKWCEDGVATYIIDTANTPEFIALKFREVGAKYVAARYFGKNRLKVQVYRYED